jgi:hypothetical protein
MIDDVYFIPDIISFPVGVLIRKTNIGVKRKIHPSWQTGFQINPNGTHIIVEGFHERDLLLIHRPVKPGNINFETNILRPPIRLTRFAHTPFTKIERAVPVGILPLPGGGWIQPSTQLPISTLGPGPYLVPPDK